MKFCFAKVMEKMWKILPTVGVFSENAQEQVSAAKLMMEKLKARIRIREEVT